LKRSDPLPLGSIVQSGPSNDLGVVIINPVDGKIIFWENIDGAESFSGFQPRRQGVEGSVGTLLSGEAIDDIVEAGSAGFLLIFSSGRLAQLLLRDGQGRAQVTVTFLRVGGHGSGGIFGGIKNVFTSSAWRKDIAAVRTNHTRNKGQVGIIAATKSAHFQFWDLSWEGQNNFRSEIDAHNELLSIRSANPPESRGQQQEIELVDFIIIGRPATGLELSVTGANEALRVLLLVALKGLGKIEYALVEADLGENRFSIRRYMPLDSYEPSDKSIATRNARLMVPHPSHTAFIIFDDAIVMTYLTEREETAEDQLMLDSGAPQRPFQDTLYIRNSARVHFSGYAVEQPQRDDTVARCALFIRGFGAIRLTSYPPNGDIDIERERVTPRSKIQQAIFFGSSPDAIFDFAPRPGTAFHQNEVEDAAVSLSSDILCSRIEFLPRVAPSMEGHLKSRAAKMEALARHLKQYYPPLSREKRWTLLWNAEKLQSGMALWNHYNDTVKSGNPASKFLNELILYLNERYKTILDRSIGENDRVRHYFTHDLDKLQLLVPWIFKALDASVKEGTKDAEEIIHYINEGDNYTIAILKTAYKFREDNLAAYGLESEHMTDGVLDSGYENLDPIWTSTHNIVSNVMQYTIFAKDKTLKLFDEAEGMPYEALCKAVAAHNPELVLICCQTHMERCRWLSARQDEKERHAGSRLEEVFFHKHRQQLISELATLGQTHEGMKLAEHFKDMPTLVELVISEMKYLHDIIVSEDSNNEDVISAANGLKQLKKRVHGYFDRFGYDWAREFFSINIQEENALKIFDPDMTSKQYLTRYLRSRPDGAKLSWINDVLNENDIFHAAESLSFASENLEANRWCRKVESSLAKLALLGSQVAASPQESHESLQKVKEQTDTTLELVVVSDKVYSFIQPILKHSLDKEFALGESLTAFYAWAKPEQPALQSVLKQGLELLLNQRTLPAPLFIDTLTLMRIKADAEDYHELRKGQFWLAIRVLRAEWVNLDEKVRDMMYALIWKRCFLQDDWVTINNTASKSDQAMKQTLSQTVFWSTIVAIENYKSKGHGIFFDRKCANRYLRIKGHSLHIFVRPYSTICCPWCRIQPVPPP
jgi:nuclear pore complex protein Nup133